MVTAETTLRTRHACAAPLSAIDPRPPARIMPTMSQGIVEAQAGRADGYGAARVQVMLGAALFSTGGAAMKACSFSGIQVAGLRSIIAVGLLVCALPSARRLRSPRVWLVGLAFAATMISFVAANKRTTAANAIFLQATSPLFILLLSPVLLRERIRGRDLALLAAILAGISCFFIGAEPARETATDPTVGNIFAIGSSVGYAFTIMGFRWLGKEEGGAASPAAGAVAGNLIAFTTALPWIAEIRESRTSDWLAIGHLGLFQVGTAYVLVTSALRRVPALEASLLLMIEPVLSPVWAFLLHGERPGPWGVAGGAVILAATLVHAAASSRRN